MSRSSQWRAKKRREMEEQGMVRPQRGYICSHCHEDALSKSHGKYDGARYCPKDPALQGITLEEWRAKKKKARLEREAEKRRRRDAEN